ncbi:MAG: apolipoprotein N-acyltransferase [Micromonosporaceae bacterium]
MDVDTVAPGRAATGRSGRERPDDPAAAPPLPAPVAGAAAVAAGVGLLLAFPPYGWWWLAPVAVALLAVAVHRRRLRAGAGLGALTGAVFFVPLLGWTNLEVGYVPWLLLAGLEAAYLALLGAAAAFASPLADRWRWTWPLLTAGLWVAQEALRSRTPFGGFPWGRLAFSQEESPLLRLAALGGAPAVTFGVALAGGLLALAGWRRWWPPARTAVAGAAAAATAAVLVVVGSALVPTADPTGPTVTVAVVQGNVPRLGLDFNAQRRAVLDNHVEATLALAAEVAAGRRPRPDLVVWPENSSDIDPLANPDARARIERAAAAVGVPILVGAILHRPGDGPRNVGLVWQPDTGPGPWYAKRHPVPFAEYLPLESLVRPIARAITDKVDRVAGFVPGDVPGVLTMGPATVGTVICFEVAYDSLVRDAVTRGGQLLAVQTNNATFNLAEARQQMAMVRLRAVEHGRWSVMASTVGVSGFAAPDGTVHDLTGFFTRDVRVRTLSLTDSRTVATTVGAWPEYALVAAAGAALALAAVRRRPTAVPDAGEETGER